MNKIYNIDCMLGLKSIESKSIDMILCDLPYGITNNFWDSVIPLENYIEVESVAFKRKKLVSLNFRDYQLFCFNNNISKDTCLSTWTTNSKQGLWSEYNRIIKDNGVICLTSDGKFTHSLIDSNKDMFRYKLIWNKKNPSGFLNAKRRPLGKHEEILIFYKNAPTYNPILEERGIPRVKGGYMKKTNKGDGSYNSYKEQISYNNLYYPTSIIEIAVENKKYHPTQKPIALFSYLIRTYTNENEVVLDNCIGVGTTALACIETNRKYIGFEKEKKYFDIAIKRIKERENVLF